MTSSYSSSVRGKVPLALRAPMHEANALLLMEFENGGRHLLLPCKILYIFARPLSACIAVTI